MEFQVLIVTALLLIATGGLWRAVTVLKGPA
jgi:hypothetical protein